MELRPHVAMWSALTFIAVSGLVFRSFEAGIDWASETPAAWVQAVGGMVTLGVTIYFALNQARQAREARTAQERAERRAQAAQHANFVAGLDSIRGIAKSAKRVTEATLEQCEGQADGTVAMHYEAWARYVNGVSESLRVLAQTIRQPEIASEALWLSRVLFERTIETTPSPAFTNLIKTAMRTAQRSSVVIEATMDAMEQAAAKLANDRD